MKKMKQETYTVMDNLQQLGISYEDANALRRISMTLRSWFERECGTDNGCIERDEETGKTYWLNALTGRRWPVPDRETGARRRLVDLMSPHRRRLVAYIQTDCRGVALYILRKSQVKRGESIDSIYNRGVAVY
jgi:hypothetical protein